MSGLRRTGMILIGIATFFAYTTVAIAGLVAVRWILANPPHPAVIVIGGAVAVLAGSYIGYRSGVVRLAASIEARVLSPQVVPTVYRRLQHLSDRMKMDPPRLLVADLAAPNALSVGGPRNSAVILDYRLFELLTADEMEGILAHELAHIESYDTFLNTLVLTTIRLFVAIVTVLLFPVIIFLTGIDRATAWIAGRPRGWTVGISQGFQYLVGIVLAGVLSILTLLFLSYSRRREYQADRRAGEMTGKPVALARALSKIHRATDPRRDLRSFLYIHDDPQREHYPFLSTHPPLDKRVNRLLEQTDAEYSTQQIDRVRF